MRTLLLTVLVSFNLVACVAGDNGSEDQITEIDTTMDVGNQVNATGSDLSEMPARNVGEAASEVGGAMTKADRVASRLGRALTDVEKTTLERLEQTGVNELTDIERETLNRLEAELAQQLNRAEPERVGHELTDIDQILNRLDGQGPRVNSIEQAERLSDELQEKLHNPTRIDQVDVAELLRGIHATR
jgi:hypothetical protein